MELLHCRWLLVAVVMTAALAATDKEKAPVGYDVAALSDREVPPKMRSVLKGNALISANPYCMKDASVLCPKVAGDNLLLLSCLQKQAERVSSICHQLLWSYKVLLSTVVAANGPLMQHCSSQFKLIPRCQSANSNNGEMVSCIINSKQNITDKNCRLTIFRMQKITFSDHRLIFGFNAACGHDIIDMKCGRVERNDTQVFDTPSGMQGQVVACLEEHIAELTPPCVDQIKKKEEAAAESAELDAPLVEACKLELSTMCKSVPPGKGNLYQCLFEHIHDPTMKSKCRRQIIRRGKEESLDYKSDYKFTVACKRHIKDYGCDTASYAPGSFVQLTSVLVCLNNHQEPDGLSEDCKAEIAIVVKQLMGNYQLNSKLAAACDQDIAKLCPMEKNAREEGGVITCLMETEKQKEAGRQLSDACSVQVKDLLLAASSSMGFALDHITVTKCRDLISKACLSMQREAKLQCLMDHMNDPSNEPACKSHLLTLQYFMARDYRMDKRFQHACQDSINKLCNSMYHGASVEYPPSQVIHCLYTKFLDEETAKQISSTCIKEVKRLMTIRAASVKLNPVVELSCINDLSFFCNAVDTAAVGEEFKCLQENLNELNADCHIAMSEWTKMEAQDVSMNIPVMRACRGPLNLFCKDIPKGTGKIIHCLIEHKLTETQSGAYTEQCRRELLDYQINVLQKYKFDHAFSEACGEDVHIYCGEDMKSKDEIINCLRSKLESGDIQPVCRDMLKTEEREKSENVELNPGIVTGCQDDIKNFCSDVKPGKGKVIECLRKKLPQLSPVCIEKLRPMLLGQRKDSSVDLVLTAKCGNIILKYCGRVESREVLSCVIKQKNRPEVTPECQSVISTREQNNFFDPELDVQLFRNCREEITKACSNYPQHLLIMCLSKLDKGELSPKCAHRIKTLQREKQTDYRFNFELIKKCGASAVFKNCIVDFDPGTGSVIECLKKHLEGLHTQQSTECFESVANLVKAARTDIHIDVMLYSNCAGDVDQFCGGVLPGDGKVITCLLHAMKNGQHREKMDPDCVSSLQSRQKMYQSLGLKSPKTVSDVVTIVHRSKARGSVLWLLSFVVVVVLLSGYLFGRKCRRASKKFS